MKNTNVKYLVQINVAMIFVATSGALGRYVQLTVPVMIAYRAALAFLLLAAFCKFKKIPLRIEKKDISIILLSGFLMGVHWVTYFYALKLSNVAIGMLSIFTFPVMTAFLEPLLLKSKLQRAHIFLGLLVLLGVYMLNPEIDFKSSKTMAIGFGLLSALVYALRNIIMKTKVAAYHGSMLMTYQTGVVAVVLFPFLFATSIETLGGQWEGILALALLTTAVGHTLFLMTFKHFKITTVSIISSVQPVYGILIGALFLSEIPAGTTILGGALILSAVVIESLRVKTRTSYSEKNS